MCSGHEVESDLGNVPWLVMLGVLQRPTVPPPRLPHRGRCRRGVTSTSFRDLPLARVTVALPLPEEKREGLGF